MLVYGDRERSENPREKLSALEGALERAFAMPAGTARHGAIVAAFIEASELAQGLADAEYQVHGCDAPSPVQDQATALLVCVAAAVVASWRSGFAQAPRAPAAQIAALRGLQLPERIRTKEAEGYAFYALYPEAYAQAAARLAGDGPFVVVGIRSIGLGLAAILAAALGAPTPVSVRPTGDPFRRRIVAAPELTARVVANPQARFLVVDEGPGLSGSSFGAVADWLESNGVPREQIVFLPSHAGDLGPQASEEHRVRWAAARREVVEFDDLVLRSELPAHGLESWIADLCGAPDEPLHDLSGGNWRHWFYGSEAEWPAANVQQERRKYLLRAGGERRLLKFVGLGRSGEEKLARARALHEAGFTPEPLGYRHGFLVEGWIEGARPLAMGDVPRARIVEALGRYLGFRALSFPVSQGAGAEIPALLAMARRNTELALGADAAARLTPSNKATAALQARVRRVDTDNRLQPWEWLVSADGGLIKTDALDHSSAHDLVGCQDIAWDVAGATFELALGDDEARELCERIAGESGHPVDPELLAFLRVAYLAFQVGAQALGAQALVGWPAEAQRLRASEARYRDLLARELSRD